MRAHAARSGLPALAGRVLEEPAVQLPGHAAVVRAEEEARVGAEPQLGIAARLEMPRCVQLQAALLRKTELLRPVPGLPTVAGPVCRRAVDRVVRGRMQGAVARVDHRVVDGPARQQRPLDVPALAAVAPDEEEAFAGADG